MNWSLRQKDLKSKIYLVLMVPICTLARLAIPSPISIIIPTPLKRVAVFNNNFKMEIKTMKRFLTILHVIIFSLAYSAVAHSQSNAVKLQDHIDNHPVVLDSNLFMLFDGMDRDNGAVPPVASTFGDFPSVILEDDGTNTAHYGYIDQLPLTEPQTVRLKLKRDIANGQSFLLRTTGAGTQELIIDLQTGAVNVSNGGAGVDPTVNFLTPTLTLSRLQQPSSPMLVLAYGIHSPQQGQRVLLAGVVFLGLHKVQQRYLRLISIMRK